MVGGHRSGCRSFLARSDRSSAVPRSRHIVQFDALSSAQLSKMLCMAIDRLNFRVDTSDNPAKQNRSVCRPFPADALKYRSFRFGSAHLASAVAFAPASACTASGGFSSVHRERFVVGRAAGAQRPLGACCSLALPCHICNRDWGSSLPHLHRDWAHLVGGATSGSSLRDRMLSLICRSTAF